MNRLNHMGDAVARAIHCGTPAAVVATICMTVNRDKLAQLFFAAAGRFLAAHRNNAPARQVAMIKSAVDLIRARQQMIDHKRMTVAEAMTALDRRQKRRPVLVYAKAA